MATGVKTGGKDFSPGESGNPDGRPPLPEDLKAARKLNKTELERILNEYIHMSLTEIQRRAGHPETSALEVLVAKVLAEGIKRGDEKRLGFLLDRLVGPVKRSVSVEGGEDGTNPIRLARSDDEIKSRIKELIVKTGIEGGEG